MDKEQIKKTLLEAVKNSPHFESFLKKTVDLLTPAAISKYFRDEVINQAETVYEKR
jgi:predicted nucleotidyltransferase